MKINKIYKKNHFFLSMSFLLAFSFLIINTNTFAEIVSNIKNVNAEKKIEDISLLETNNRWISKSKNWNKIFSDWHLKRDFDSLEVFGPKDYNSDDPEYCDFEICWKETETKFIIRKSDKILNLSKDGNSEAEFFNNSDKWISRNDSSDLNWTSSYGDSWVVLNYGEKIIFKDNLLNKWSIIDFGKRLIFQKNNGQKIEKKIKK